MPSFILSNISSPVFSCAHMSAGTRLSDAWFLALMKKNCWSHEAAPGRTLMRVIWKLQRRWPLAKREWTRTGEAGRRGSSASFLLKPGRLWVKSCVQRFSSLDAAAMAVGREAMHTAVRGVRLWRWSLRSRYPYPRRASFSLDKPSSSETPSLQQGLSFLR